MHADTLFDSTDLFFFLPVWKLYLYRNSISSSINQNKKYNKNKKQEKTTSALWLIHFQWPQFLRWKAVEQTSSSDSEKKIKGTCTCTCRYTAMLLKKMVNYDVHFKYKSLGRRSPTTLSDNDLCMLIYMQAITVPVFYMYVHAYIHERSTLCTLKTYLTYTT